MTFSECIAVGLIGVWLMLAPPKAMACDCSWYAYSALKASGLRMKTVPSIVVSDQFKYPGAYSRSVVYVKDIDDCRVRLHEFVHHIQWLRYGDATDGHEWQRRENQAAMVTMLAEANYGVCI